MSIQYEVRATAYFAEDGTAQWDEAWASLDAEFGDTIGHDADSGEYWQYMGTWLHGDVWDHQFRHRSLKGVRHVRNYPSELPPLETKKGPLV